jgi:hypothetical protein
MATKKVQIDILARDRSRQALKSVQGGLNNLKNTVFSLKSAIIGIGAGATIKTFIDVGSEVEKLQVRLKFLFGTAEEGAKAFDVMAKFASKVPFSLEEIQKGAGVLAVVSKDADELSDILKITGNVAAVTGLDFRTTAEQIQRSLSAGISAADLFRERGVKAMLGFQAGATVSIEQTVKAFNEVFGPNGQFGRATDDLAKTFEGTLSMIGDSIFNFKKEVADAGLFDFVKFTAETIDKAIKDNFISLEVFAQRTSHALIDAFENIALGFAQLGSIFQTPVKIIIDGTKQLLSFMASIPEPFRTLGIIGFLMTGFRGKAVLILIGAFFQEIQNLVIRLFEFLGKELEKVNNDLNDELLDLLENADEKVKEFFGDIKMLTDEFGFNKFEIVLDEDGPKMIKKFFADFKLRLNASTQTLGGFVNSINNTTDGIKDGAKELSKFAEIALSFKKGFTATFDDATNLAKQFEEAGKRAFRSFDAELKNALKNGKFRFKEFREAIIVDLSAILIKQQLIIAAQRILGAMKGSSVFGNIFGTVGKIFGFANGGMAKANQPAIVGEKGPELIVPKQNMQVIPNHQLGGGQPVNVNFNISTVDASGFNELLVNSRGVIVNMINSAVNETGRQAIV